MRPAYKVLYSFAGSKDGSDPFASLIDVKGVLYGTTAGGGAHGGGTVFSITTPGQETVLYSFKTKVGAGDGVQPTAGLISVKGALYGTTYYGGANGAGTVFSIAPSGTETVLHSFGLGSGDGIQPNAGLINVRGTLYGTTDAGGTGCTQFAGCGTVFTITPSGAQTVLYRFKGGSGDGAFPQAALVDLSGTLYGTTEQGDGTACYKQQGCGTVFAITPSGAETVFHSFKSGHHGKYPFASLIRVKGTLYGTTLRGGTNNLGTIFSLTPSGAEIVLHSFQGGSVDGAEPYAGLIYVEGALYGTTSEGGTNNVGTVFAITPSGAETVLHNFGGSGDGEDPLAGLINVNGTLYGTTKDGGANGTGTVFSITP